MSEPKCDFCGGDGYGSPARTPQGDIEEQPCPKCAGRGTLRDLIVVSMHEKGFPQADIYDGCGDMDITWFNCAGMTPDGFFTMEVGQSIADAMEKAKTGHPGAVVVLGNNGEDDEDDVDWDDDEDERNEPAPAEMREILAAALEQSKAK